MKRDYSSQLGYKSVAHANRVLMKDLVYHFIFKLGLNKCYRCGGTLDRDDFTIDHKIPWRHSDNPLELFFNIENVKFSHFSCNSANARQPLKNNTHGHNRYTRGCRCDLCKEGHRKRIAERRSLGKMK